jgi:aquaporin TIP
MDQRIRTFLAELVGTFVVVLIGAGTVCTFALPHYPAGSSYLSPILTLALAEGFALAVMLTAVFFLSSGCLNPAITVALWVMRRLDGGSALLLVIAQLLGSVLAGLAVRLLFSDVVLDNAGLGAPHLKALLDSEGHVTLAGIGTGVCVEALCTFFVSLAAFATLFDPRAPKMGGLFVGMAQAAVILFAYPITGGAANPARWFGPVVWQLSLNSAPLVRPLADHAVYWAGPMSGALLGCLFYATVFLPTASQKR